MVKDLFKYIINTNMYLEKDRGKGDSGKAETKNQQIKRGNK
jgi:hypothetical protein